MTWFDHARFGMFIHWGHISQRGWELSWPLVGGSPALPRCQSASVAEYHASAGTFQPRPNSPREWLERAHAAGMQYAVFTTKHHDGFALFRTAASPFSVAASPSGGDIVREYVDAARALGLRVGLYFSLCDWHHPDYPAFADVHRPYQFGMSPRPSAEQWQAYRQFMFAQVRELLTNYGRIDVLWFDGGWERNAEAWDAAGLHAMIRALQPDILVNDRLPGFGDFETPEQFVPPRPLGRPWETCLTMNDSWAYNPSDTAYKSARELVHILCETAGRGGNLLLNVGPMGDGRLPPEQCERLDAIARWMEAHRQAIIATQPGVEPWQFYGPSTRAGNRLYLHLLQRPYDTVTVRGVPVRHVQQVRVLGANIDVAFRSRCTILDNLFNADPFGELIIDVPEPTLDPLATVLEVAFDCDAVRAVGTST